MLHTTFRRLKEAGACVERYKKFAEFKGGVNKWGKDKLIPLSEVLEVCGLQDAIWCFRCTRETSENTLIEFSCQCAEHVLHFYEDKYPADNRPHKAIEAARVCITDKSPAARAAAWAAWEAAGEAGEAAWAAGDAARAARAAAWAAGDAAWDAGAAWEAARAVGDAARAAAWDAGGAGDAAWDAETEWQTQQLKELLRG